MNKTAITTGDLFGIGEEITAKALLELNLPRENVIIIGKKLNTKTDYPTIEIEQGKGQKGNGKFCYDSLALACEMAKKGEIGALVTAPVSKEILHKAGYEFSGQTEILEKLLGDAIPPVQSKIAPLATLPLSSARPLTTAAGNGSANPRSSRVLDSTHHRAEMLFIARDLRVMLLTRHMPLIDVAKSINEEMIIEKTVRLNNFLREKLKIQKPKIAFCALNPHAGESGILGREEIEIINPAISKLRDCSIDVTDALSADGLFAKIGEKYLNNSKQDYDAIISTYHDQALTAIKALAFNEVVNTTIGLKIIRTSPSCGTAYDIFGKNIANPQSMIEAVKLARELSK